jgi:predicted O-methyltransferase YrrM
VRESVRRVAEAAKGFLDPAEGMRLYELARLASRAGPCLEIGSYCGKSALYLGEGCRETGQHPLFTVDHHRGSEEQQPGEEYFDPTLWDPRWGGTSTLPELLANLRRAGLEDWVVAVVAESSRLGRHWSPAPLGLVFIDGGHSEAAAFADYRTWAPRLRTGGYLCVHDVFPDPRDGGQAPYHVVGHARSTGEWADAGTEGSLVVLRRR